MAVEKTESGCAIEDVCCMHIEANVETFLKIVEALGWAAPTAVPA
jgi:hypothetical protein